MTRHGKITAVKEHYVHTDLTAAAPAGAQDITVADLGVLDWEGGQLLLGTETRGYTIPLAPDPEFDEIDADDVDDVDEGTVHLDSPLALAHDEDARVFVLPLVREQFAAVQLLDQAEEVMVRVPQKHGDDLDTRIRADGPDTSTIGPDQETVELSHREDEHVISDLTGLQRPGRSRGYTEVAGPVDCAAGTAAAPTIIGSLNIDIPTAEHRLLFWASAYVSAADGTAIRLSFMDDGQDFPDTNGLLMATFFGGGDPGGGNGFTGPAFVATALDVIDMRDSAAVPLPNGLITGNVVSQFMPSVVMPYNEAPPTVGLHNFRIVGYRHSGAGSCSVSDLKFWATVI